jgi:hypothetical protein
VPVVFYGHETWSLISNLIIFENRALRRIFRKKRNEVIGSWRKLHNKVLQNVYPSPSIIIIIMSMMMRWPGHIACMQKRNAYRALVGNPEGKIPLGRPRYM